MLFLISPHTPWVFLGNIEIESLCLLWYNN